MDDQIVIAREYLEIAKTDLKSSRLLYEYKIYNNAIFELQQAVEKVTKCFCLNIKVNKNYLFSLDDLKGKEGHNSLEFLIKIIDKYIIALEKLTSIDVNLKSTLLSLLKERRDAMKYINGKETREEIIRELKGVNNFSDISLSQFKGALTIFGPKKSDEEIEKEFQLLNVKVNNNELLNQLNKFILPLVFLGAITFKHECSTRYPFDFIDNQGNINYNIKPEEYKPGLGIIDAFQDVEELLKSVIIKLEEGN